MQMASEQHTAHGIEYINSMPTLDNAGPHIDMHVVLCNIYKLNRNIWPRSMTLLKMI
jgi:hypothetical protein